MPQGATGLFKQSQGTAGSDAYVLLDRIDMQESAYLRRQRASRSVFDAGASEHSEDDAHPRLAKVVLDASAKQRLIRETSRIELKGVCACGELERFLNVVLARCIEVDFVMQHSHLSGLVREILTARKLIIVRSPRIR